MKKALFATAALATIMLAPSLAHACQCSGQIAQATAEVNANTNAQATGINANITAMQAAIVEALRLSTTQMTAVARQQTAAQERMIDNTQELEKLRAGNAQHARIRDDQKMTPQQADQYCSTLNAGAQAGSAAQAVAAMSTDMARRGEARNVFQRNVQPVQAALEVVHKNYCDAASEEVGACKAVPGAMQNADISARNLLYGPTLSSTGSVTTVDDMPYNASSQEAAVRFCETLAKPYVNAMNVPPKASADGSVIGSYLRDRNDAQRANLVQQYCYGIVSTRTPTIVANDQQKKLLAEMYSGLSPSERPPVDRLSYNQLVALEVDQRFGRGSVAFGERLARNKSSPDQLMEVNLSLAVMMRIMLDQQRTMERGFAMMMASPAAQVVNSTTSTARQ